MGGQTPTNSTQTGGEKVSQKSDFSPLHLLFTAIIAICKQFITHFSIKKTKYNMPEEFTMFALLLLSWSNLFTLKKDFFPSLKLFATIKNTLSRLNRNLWVETRASPGGHILQRAAAPASAGISIPDFY